MSSLSFALKRTVSSKAFMLFLLLIAVAVFAASFYGSFAGLPPAGIYNAGSGYLSQRVVALLNERGFVEYNSTEEMQNALQQGEIDCSVILPADFDARFEAGETKGIISFISTASSFAPMIYQSHISAVLFSEYAPYITAASLAEYAIPQEEVLQKYEAMLADGYAFSFELLSAEGVSPENVKSHNLMMGAAAILLFIAICILSVSLLQEAFSALSLRIGKRKSLLHIILPNLAVRALFSASAAAIGLVAAGVVQSDEFCFRLIPAVFVYCMLLMAAALLLAAICPQPRNLNILLTLLVLASLAFCPFFVDIAMLSSIIEAVRYALPCFWLWAIPENMLLWTAIAIIALPLCYAIFLFRCKTGRKLNLR